MPKGQNGDTRYHESGQPRTSRWEDAGLTDGQSQYLDEGVESKEECANGGL